jgi:polysaccharide export outer membrane protein
VPRELSKITLPSYVIEAPDNLLIEVVRVGNFPVTVTDEKGEEKTLEKPLIVDGKPVIVDGKETKVPVTRLGSQRLPIQAISGPFQVRIDGTVGLGFWGSVTVAGLSLEQAQQAIKEHLLRSETLGPKGLGAKPESLVVIVDVLAYNSKRYYVILDGGGYGEQVIPFPITGSETVLDALANVFGLQSVASKRNIWVARRCPHPDQPWQILPVDWIGITQHGYTNTNYQIMPGDRIYVKAQRIVTFDTALARVIQPIERLFGITLLGVNTVNQFKVGAATSTGQ